MEIVDIFGRFFSDQDFLFKIILIITTIFYGLFAIILAVQINSLNKIIDQIDFSPFFNTIALVHVVAAIALVFLTVVFL